MRHKNFAEKISYVCIFTKTIEEASENLVRLITSGDSGFDEGISAWRDVLSDFLQASDGLDKLNQFGATFTAAQWNLVLQQVQAALSSR